MSIFLNFNFLAILNLLIIILYPAVGYYRPAPAPDAKRMDVLGIILLILTVVAVLADIIFMVKAVH